MGPSDSDILPRFDGDDLPGLVAPGVRSRAGSGLEPGASAESSPAVLSLAWRTLLVSLSAMLISQYLLNDLFNLVDGGLGLLSRAIDAPAFDGHIAVNGAPVHRGRQGGHIELFQRISHGTG